MARGTSGKTSPPPRSVARARATGRPTPPAGANGRAFAHLGDLTPDHRNARTHGPRNVGAIVSALHEVGAARSIVIDEAGRVLAGNATVEAAGEAGLTKLQIVDADGQTIVAVRRSGLTEAQKVRLALFDNRAAELAVGWEAGMLAELQAEGVGFEGLWTEEELAALLAPAGGETEAPVGAAGDSYAEQYGVIVICQDEGDQRQTYEKLTELGLKCKVVTT